MSFVVVARYVVQPGERDRVLELLTPMVAASLAEPGCRRYGVHTGVEDDVVVLVEEYDGEADFARHCETEHFQRIVLGQVVPLLADRQVTRCTPFQPGAEA
ncbi:Quinol monooxygenase YgiN [Saccharopolyspora antimicrobica]|uniref:Quinol monooxygenase YgiN n=1 Tax=Saccharopolyspora antimicrobica TaxID=455193 RepID=A0A1I5LQ09_9PSEU|nr:antibiotic biosynthesis monooxygenase [Saccharopolyspora antimicrobica]RKT87864.1 quinol monooxygenase YgiN [Saccharopolyspora antimicrobica]SFO99315.1 Quinol monooxygenase YgiN [Saccharopolyspora antimicrobica]